MKSKRLLLSMLLCFAFFGLARAEIVEIGDGTSAGNYTPIGTYYNYSFTEQLYLAEEIGMAGTIQSIGFNYAYSTPKDFPIEVYMKAVDATDLSSAISIEDGDLVFSGTLSVSGPGWATIELDTPFVYDGTSNLLIAVNKDYVYWFSANTWYYTTVSNKALYARNDNSGYTPTISLPSMSATTDRPNVQFDITSSGGNYCPRPTGLASTLTPGNGTVATLSWTENGDASSWQICLNDDETNLIEVSENPYTLTGLTAETTYTAKVRANCGSSQSAWSNTISFTPTDAYQLTVNDGTMSNEYVPVYGYYCDMFSKSQFIIPAESLQDLYGGIITQMTFYSSNSSVGWGNAEFEVYMTEVDYTSFSSAELVDWNTMDKVMNARSLSISDNQMVVEFDNVYEYLGGNLLVGIRQTTQGSYVHSYWYGVSASSGAIGGYENSRGLAIYDFLPKTTFDFIPSGSNYCPRPTSLTASDITPYSAFMSWASSASSFDLRYAVVSETRNSVSYTNNATFEKSEIDLSALQIAPNVQPNVNTGTEHLRDGWYYYDNGTYVSSIGTGGSTVYWGSMFPAGMIYETSLTKVALYENDQNTNAVTVYVYQGGDVAPGDLLYSQDFTPVGSDAFHEVTLTNPVPVDPSQNLWIVFGENGSYPINCCANTGDANGRWVSLDGSTWADLSSYGLDYSLMVRAYFEGLDPNAVEWIEVTGINEQSYNLTGLTPETHYIVQVRSNCGEEVSDWSYESSFITPVACYVPSNLVVTGMTENSAVASWTAGSESQSEWDLRYKTINENEWTLVEGLTETTYTFSGLTEATGYEVQVRGNCGTEYGVSNWIPTVLFSTLQTPWNLTDNPYSTDFEDGYDWVLFNGNGSYTNVWVYGEATNNTENGSHSLYISNDGGVTNSYTITSTSAVYATKLFTLAEGYYSISYDWKAYGENTWDFLRVALVPVGETWPVYNHDYNASMPENWINADGGRLNLSSDWQSNYIEVEIQTAGDYYLTFAWFNDSSVGTDTPGAIDNVSIAGLSCVTPTNLSVADVDPFQATLSWTVASQSLWDIAYKTTDEEDFTIIESVGENPYTLSGLTSETTYIVKVRSNCGENVSNWSNEVSFTTPIACHVPTDFAVSNVSDHSAVVTWTAGSTSQSQWDLQYKTVDEAEWTMVQGLTETTYTFSELVSGMGYDVKVRANCGGAYGVSDWTDSISFIANFCPLEEQCIINYSLADSYGDGWNGNAIQVVDVETNIVFATVTLASGSNGTGSISLCPNRTYHFNWVTGYYINECSFVLSDADGNEILAGNHSDLPFDFTNCDITCKRPKNVNATTIEPYMAVLTWTSGEAWDFAYKTYYDTHFTVVENIVDNTYTMSDLIPETTYVVKVRSNCGETVSYWSDEYYFTTTEACPKPTNLQASVSLESVFVSWTPGTEAQSEWDLQYRMAGQSEWTTVSGLTEPNYTITSLGNSTTYYVRVRGICEVPSNWTNSISFTSEQIYVFNTFVDEDVYPMNTTIPIHGTVISYLNNAPVANLDVEIGVTVMGWRRTLTAITDGNGQFTVNFEPMPLESGYYTVNSGTVGSNSNEVHDSFDIMGMNVMEYTLNEELNIVNTQWLLCNVIQYIPQTGHILIRNNNSFALTNVQISVISAPEGASFTFTPTSVAGLTEGYIEYTALGTILTPGYTYQEVRLRATCDQGAEAIFTMWFYCEEARGILNASPTAINTTMTRGSSKTIDVTLSNNGHAASGEISISLPNEEWMSVVGETTLPSIEVGETATFTLRLSPDNTVPLAQYSGNIVVSCDHGESVTIPYSILAVSEENGTLVVDVTDEFTTNTNNGNGPHVEGAEVTLKGYYSQETVAHGFTAADGTFTVEDLAEGYYNLSVQAGAHSRYDGTIYVEAGVTNQQNVFLQYQCVSYSWHVEPTEITDEYTIVLNMEFEVEVPVPVITIQAPGCVTVEDDSYTFNYVVTNHGLIDAYNVALYVPDNEYYMFTPLYDFIDTIHGHSSVEIPCVVTLKMGVNDPEGEWGQTRVQYSYLSGDDLVYNQAINYTRLGCSYTYTAGGTLPPLDGGGGGGAPIMPGTGPVGPGNGGSTTPWIDNQLPTVDVRVGVQFTQRLTMTREAFIGTFAVHNGHATNAVNGIGLDFIIKNEQGVDCTDLFQIAVQSMDGVTSIDGNGTLAAGADGTVEILFIPTKEAAPTEPILYSFGGTFTFVDPWDNVTRVMNLYPTELEVHPSPDLYIDYFVQEDVYGDNPITLDSIEPIIPAELAVRIWNKGAGTAKNVILESAEPIIVSNQQGLIIDFGLYGAYIDGVGAMPGLNRIEFGDIESGETKVGEWLFTSTLLAHLVSYDAQVIHNNSYGNPNLSLVSHVGIHKLTHAIHTIGTRIDGINDFLVDDIPDENNYPDSIFFSNGGRTSVGVVEGISFDKFVTPHDTIVTLTVNPSRIGWNYGETEDPGRNRYELVSCTRNNDGENIPLSNIWQESIILHETGDSLYANKLRIVDTVSVMQTVTYTLVFAGNPNDPYIFFGDDDEYWSNAANWEGSVKPHSPNDNVIIDGICLLDEDATVSSLTVIEGLSLTIPEDRLLTVSNNLDNTIASGLVIEEGGQLMHSNAGAQATVQKSIAPYTPGTKDGWYLVAHPMASNLAITTVENMLDNEYDLYYYDEPTVYWINQEDASNNFTELENGKGYLYGNNEEITLRFAGELQSGTATVEIPLSYTAGPRLAGFNLVGNPYAHNVTSYTSENVVDGCFVMNEAKDDLIVSEINAENPLKPIEGFFVKASDENASITFNPQRIDLMSPNGTISVELTENGKLVDRLLVKTSEGQPLEKLSLNEMRTKLFAQDASQELAIVPCQSNEQPVSFKASRNGQYTVAVNADGMEFDYLHLVDNLSGEDVDLLVDPNYTFEARTSDYTSRFLLRFIMREGNASETENFVYFFDDKMVIANEGRATLQVVDLLGHILSSEQINGSCEKQIHAAPGVYMFRLINGDNVKVQKVVVKR